MSPKTGRPKAENPKGLRFSIRLDNDLASRLDDYCNKNNCKRSEAIRKGINLLLEK
ncbi:MAG: ribbon-helix-helix domain-containing protein [Eubacterium sp.]|nr:ribbon-helix-helix domain-containing protein [Eubacterium sp.]